MSKPAPAVSTRPKATWPTINDARTQSRPMISALPPSFKVEMRLVLEAAMAGIIPKINPAAKDTNTAKESTRGSTPASAARGTLSPISERMIGVQTKASPQPARALRTRLSASSWRTIRFRPAPRADRSAISRWRSRMRASSRLAMLPHAISSTKATAPNTTRSAVRVSPINAATSVCTRAELWRVLVSGYCFARLAAIVRSS